MGDTNWCKDKKMLEELRLFSDTVPIDMFEWLKSKVFDIRKKNVDARPNLAGHLQEEYFILAPLSKPNFDTENDINNWKKFEDYITRGCLSSPLDYMWEKQVILTENRNLCITSCWINFQKKYEFNPPHIHTGIYSFIIFLNIPYDLQQEKKVFPSLENSQTSNLFFQYQVPLFMDRSGIKQTYLQVDKSYEGKIIIFPANLSHGVLPFYTSDDYRITISGNVIFEV